jgi:hypothetical protein
MIERINAVNEHTRRIPANNDTSINNIRQASNASADLLREEAAPAGEPASDTLTVSERANVDLALFNYIDRGGDAGRVLGDGLSEEGSFEARPDFSGMGLQRYGRMKEEIMLNYADDTSARAAYLKELERAFQDYMSLQARITGEERMPEPLPIPFQNSNVQPVAEPEQQVQDDAIGNAENYENRNDTDNTQLSREFGSLMRADSAENKAVWNWILGERGNNNEISEEFLRAYLNNMGANNNFFDRRNQPDPHIRQMWEGLRLSSD